MTIHFNVTPQDMAAWTDWHFLHAKDNKQLIRKAILFGVLLVSMLGGLGTLMILSYAWLPAWLPGLWAVIMVAYFIFFFPKKYRKQYHSQMLKMYSSEEHKKLLGPQTLEINEEGLIALSAEATSLIKWSTIDQIIVIEDYAFLRIGTLQAFVIPRAAVEEANFDTFVTEAKRLHALATGEKVALPLRAMS